MKNISYHRVLAHLAYWIIFIFGYPIFFNLLAVNNLDIYPAQVKNIAKGSFYLILAAYFISYYLIPTFLTRKRKYLFFFLLYLLTFITITVIDIFLTRYTIIPKEYPQYIDTYLSEAFRFKSFLRTLLILHSEVFIFIAVRFFIHYLKGYFEKENLKIKMIETELNMLKGQIHPHFLFNTLNNIYTLSLECHSKKLSESIAKMSEILRFSLYECNSTMIPLEKELRVIKDYIDLEKLRYKNIDIQLSIPKKNDDIYIIPLILFTFIENAFKHGTSKTIGNKWIKIDLLIENYTLHFNVKNSKCSKNNTENFQDYTKGIGLKNATKRLELFYNKGTYSLDINNNDVFFEVNLCLKLSKKEKSPTVI